MLSRGFFLLAALFALCSGFPEGRSGLVSVDFSFSFDCSLISSGSIGVILLETSCGGLISFGPFVRF